jgi:hypothetical protein
MRSAMYLPDPIERGEQRCEDWYFRNVRNGVAKCQCGEAFKIEDGETLSADPYAIPVCPTCAEAYFAARK